MKCEVCGQTIRVSQQYPGEGSKNYKEWQKHNKEVKRSGFGAALCWRHWKEAKLQEKPKHKKVRKATTRRKR